ncbi:MAG TPA: hypothetical protein VGB37_03730 [Candidatus Lokiarchaeia archaeon]
MVKIKVRCPLCDNTGNIEIDNDVIKNDKRGIIAINLRKDQICSHSFIVYLDRNLAIRDSFLLDFELETPQIEIVAPKENKEIKVDDLKIDIIKLNFIPLTFSYILRGVFFKKKIIVINENQFINDLVLKFFNVIFQNTFDINISFILESDYKIDKKKYYDTLIVEGNRVINDKEKICDLKKLKIEREIINRFFLESNLMLSVLILKNEIQKAFSLTISIVKFIKCLDKSEKINLIKIVDKLEKDYAVKITKIYFNFLIEIVKYYFKIELPMFYDNLIEYI